MDDEQKPFDIVSIVILMLIAVANDALEIVFDLLAATGIGLPGEAIMKPIDFLIDGVVTSWFFMKLGFGGPSLAQLLDDVLEVFGVPGRTICVGFGIYLANHPKSKLGQIAQVATTVGGGGTGVVSEMGEAAKGVQAAEQLGESTEGAAKTVETGTGTEETSDGAKRKGGGAGTEGGGQESEERASGGGDEAEAARRKRELELELGEPETPEEEMEKTFEETPMMDYAPQEEDDDTQKPKLLDVRSPKKGPSSAPPAEENRKAA